MACGSCGARRGHLGGCPQASGSGGGGGSKRAGKPKNAPGHKHNYQQIRKVETRYRDGRKKMILTTWTYECLTPGCPRPTYEEYDRRMALWRRHPVASAAARSRSTWWAARPRWAPTRAVVAVGAAPRTTRPGSSPT